MKYSIPVILLGCIAQAQQQPEQPKWEGLWPFPSVQIGPPRIPNQAAPRYQIRKPLEPWEEESDGFKSYFGVKTHEIKSCRPGKVSEGSSSLRKNVPCECLGMVQQVQAPRMEFCDEQFVRTGDRKQWLACHAAVPACADIVERGYSELWGHRYQSRCQTYCKDQNCQCCDQGRPGKNNAHRGSRTPVLVSVNPKVLNEKISSTCTAIQPHPLTPMDMFHSAYANIFK